MDTLNNGSSDGNVTSVNFETSNFNPKFCENAASTTCSESNYNHNPNAGTANSESDMPELFRNALASSAPPKSAASPEFHPQEVHSSLHSPSPISACAGEKSDKISQQAAAVGRCTKSQSHIDK